MTAKILCIDVERQHALVEGIWELGDKRYISPTNIVEPSRVICYAYQWIMGGKDTRVRFAAEWDGDRPQENSLVTPGGGHRDMIEKSRELLNEADYVVGWNSASFDVPHLLGHQFAYGMSRPSPHIDIDLMRQLKGSGKFMSYRLGYISEQLGLEGKENTGGGNLWSTLRWADGEVLRRARRRMRKYNMRDTELTTEMYHLMKPWLKKLNLPLYEDPESEDFNEPRCPNCLSFNLKRDGWYRSPTRTYQKFECRGCGKYTHAKNSAFTTEARGI